MQGGERYNSISNYLKREFGEKTVKLSIDAGFTCPNRDGTLGYGGCAFCSEGGSGELAAHMDAHSDGGSAIAASISEQIDTLSAKWPGARYLAYFQSFTNTYAPVDVLRERYYAALDDPRISGIAIATRPDCLGDDVLGPYADYERSVRELTDRGIRVVTHLILGLPGETEEMMLESVRKVCSLPVFGIKLHLMNIVKTSPLYKAMPDYVPFDSIEEYVDLVVRCLQIIPPEVTIHRLTGDVPRRILVSPEWSYRKRTILNAINKELKDRDTCQGASI